MAVPTDVSGLRLWLKADAGTFQDAARTTPASSNDDPVGGWADQSGGSRHVSQATAGRRPLLKTNSLNSLPGIQFDGTDDFLANLAAGALTAAGSSYTKYLVVTFSSLTGGNTLGGGGTNGHYLFTSGTAFPRARHVSTDAAISTRSLVVSTPLILSARYDAAVGVAWVAHDGQVGGAGAAVTYASDTTIDVGVYTASVPTGVYLNGRIHEIVEYSSALSAADDTAIIQYLNGRWATRASASPNTVIAFEGDSLTYGFGATSGGGTTATSATNYPGQVMAALGGTYTSTNSGVTSETIVQMTTDEKNVEKFYDSLAPRNILCYWGGTNDLKAGTVVATVETLYQTYCQRRRSLGWKVVAVTMLPRGDGVPGDFETSRQTFNTWLRASWATFADAFADVAADGRIGDAGDNLDLTYYGADTVHLTDAGYAVVAGLVTPQVRTLLPAAATSHPPRRGRFGTFGRFPVLAR